MRATPDVAPADGRTPITISISVATDGGILPNNVAVVLTSSDANAMITQPGTARSDDGTFTATVRSVHPGTQTISGALISNETSVALDATILITFNPAYSGSSLGVPDPNFSTLIANPNQVSGDGMSTTQLTLTVNDSTHTPVVGAAVTFTSSGTNNFFSPVSGLTDARGALTTALASTTDELKTVTAHMGAAAVSTSVLFSAVVPSAVLSTLVTNPNTVPADGTSTTTVILTLLNAEGLPVSGEDVAWLATGSDDVFVVNATQTDVNGQATATLASTAVESKAISVTCAGFTLTQYVSFTAGPVNGPTSSFSANPNLVAADNSSASILTFTARDTYGNAASGAAVTFSSTGSHNTITPAVQITNNSGVATATFVSSTAETKIVTASSDNANLTATVIFLAGSPSATTSVLTANPTFATADGSTPVSLTVVLEDAEGNPVQGQAVTFSSTGTNNTFGQIIGVTDTTGSFSTTLTSTMAESKTVTAAFLGGEATTNVLFVAGAPSALTTSVSASPSPVTADGTSTTLVTVVVKDSYGNPVGARLVSLSASGSNNTFNPASGDTDASGVLTATLASTTAETKTITALAGSASATTSVTFVAGTPSDTTTTFVANPVSVTADGSSQSTLTVTVQDVYGNAISGQSVSVNSSGTNNSLSPTSGTTNASGIFTATLASATAQTDTVTATVGAISKVATVTFTAGAPAAGTTSVVANPTSVTANGTSTSTITVTVEDAQGNPVQGKAVSLGISGSNNIFAQTSGTTNSAGVFSTTLASTTAEGKTITATAGTVNKTATVTFTADAASSTTSTLSANPSSITADGTSTTSLTFTVKDAWGNAVPNQAVSLSSSGASNTFNPSSGTTNSLGVFAATLASTKAEGKTITGTAGAATATTNVTFVAGAASSLTTTLVANPTSVAADGLSTTTLTTTALDAQGNPVSGQTVALSCTGSTNTVLPASGTTNPSGVFTATLSSTTAEAKTVSSLVAGSITKTANVTFTTPVVSQSNSTIVANPTSLTADGTSTTTVTVTVRDSSNTIVVGAAVSMSATGSANTFTPLSGTADSSGVFTTTLSSTQAGVKTVNATVDGTALSTTVTFLAGSPSSTTTTFTANPNIATADGNSAATLTVLVEDANGNPVANQAVTFASSGGNNTITPISGSTDATGTLTATMTSTKAETKTLTATLGGITKNTTVTFAPGSVNAGQTTLVAAPTSVTANGISTTTLTTTVNDAEGNPVPNQLVSLSSTGTNNTFTPVSGNTNASGVFTATLSSTLAQVKNVTATVGTVTANASVTFTAGAPSNTTSTLVAVPTSLTADGATTTALTVTVKDAQGNVVQGQSVVLSGSGSSNTFGAASGATNGSGVYSTTLSSTVAQIETITATLGATNVTAAVTFVPGAVNSGMSKLVASPNTLTADGVAHSTLTVTVKDAYGNVVPNQTVSLGSTGTSNTLSPTSGTTNSVGVFTATLASTKAEVKTVTATIGAVNETATITFTAGSPSSSTTTVVASPTSVTADGVSTTTLTVTVEDAQGNPVNGQAVSFSSTGATNTFTPASGNTNSAGVFTATLASTTAQTKTVTATAGAAAPTATVTFTAGAPSNVTCSVTATPGLVSADGSSTTSVVVTAKDAFANLVANQAVSVGSTGTNNTWGSTSGTTNAAGTWSTTLASSKAQSETITATIGTVSENTSVTFVAGTPNSTYSALTATPNQDLLVVDPTLDYPRR